MSDSNPYRMKLYLEVLFPTEEARDQRYEQVKATTLQFIGNLPPEAEKTATMEKGADIPNQTEHLYPTGPPPPEE